MRTVLSRILRQKFRQNVPYNGQNVPYKKRNSYSPKEFQTPKEYLKNTYKECLKRQTFLSHQKNLLSELNFREEINSKIQNSIFCQNLFLVHD